MPVYDSKGDKVRQTLPRGARPGGGQQRITRTTTTTKTTAPAGAEDKRLSEIVQGGGVGVWTVKGSKQKVFGVSRDQAAAEAERRGIGSKGLKLSSYVKLSDMDRQLLTEKAAALEGRKGKPEPTRTMAPRRTTSPELQALSLSQLTDLYEKDPKAAAREVTRRGYEPKTTQSDDGSNVVRLVKRRSAEEAEGWMSQTPAPALSDSAFSDEDRRFIESVGGVIGTISEAEAARMEATSKSNAQGYSQPAGTKPHQVVTKTEEQLSDIVAEGGVGIWHVYDENTKTSYKVEAIDRDQAERIAKQQGMKPGNVYAFTSRQVTAKEREGELLAIMEKCAKSKADQDDFERLIRLGYIAPDVKYERGKIDVEQRARLALAGLKVNDKLMGKLARYYMPEHEAYDLIGAIRGGLSDSELREAGFDMDVVRQTREWAERNEKALTAIEPYQVKPGEYDIIAAAKWVPRDVLKDAGFDDKAFARISQVLDENDSYATTLMKYRNDEGYDIVGAYQDGVSRQFLVNVGFDEATVNKVADHVDAAKFLGDSRGDVIKRVQTGCYGGSCTITPDKDDVVLDGGGHCRREKYDTLPSHMREELNKLGMDGFEEKYLGTGQTTKDVLADTGLSMIPIYGTYHVYKTGRPTWEVAVSAGLDILWVVPPIRMLAGAARMGTKLTVRSFASAAKTIAVAELRAPIDMLAHPKATLKLALDPIESAFRGSKVPLESATITYHTVKVPSVESNMPGLPKVGWTREQAMEARDELMRLAIQQGKSPKMTIGAEELKLERSLLEKVGPVAVSGTEDIRPFMKGATIGVSADPKGAGRSLFVAPNLAERFTVASSGGKVTEGGIRGGLIIRDPKVLEMMESSAKSYQGTAEVEMILKPGAQLPPPSQTLFTRDLQGNKITLLVFGKPYNAAEIAGLKIFAPQETVKQIFARRVVVTDKANIFDDLVALDAEIAKAEAQAAKATGAQAKAARAEVAAMKARRAEVAADAARRASVVPQYAGVDTSGGRGAAALRRMVGTAADLQTTARVEARRNGDRVARAAAPRASTRVSTEVTPRIPAELRKRAQPEERAILSPEPRATTLPDRVAVPEEPYTPSKPETQEPLRMPATPRVPTYVPGPIPPRKASGLLSDEERRLEDPGAVQWRQGAYWIKVEPPPTEGERQRNVYYSRRPFWGVRVVKGTPEETFSRQGKPPRQFLYEMGIAHASIHSYEKPHIRWRQTAKAKRRRGKLI